MTKNKSDSGVRLDLSNKDLLVYGDVMKSAYMASALGILTFGVGNVFASYYCEMMSKNVAQRQTSNSAMITELLCSMNVANIKLAKVSFCVLLALLIALHFHSQTAQVIGYVTATSYAVFVAVVAGGLLMIRKRWTGVLESVKQRLGVVDNK